MIEFIFVVSAEEVARMSASLWTPNQLMSDKSYQLVDELETQRTIQ
jgi:hypothetical protein